MIIFTRWGFLVVIFAALGAGLGFGLEALFTGSAESGQFRYLGLGWMLAGAGLWLFTRTVLERHLDKAQPLTVTERLAQPYVHPNGVVQHLQTVPLLHPQTGQQMWRQPRSTLFFIPVRIWVYLLGGGGLAIFLGSLVTSLF